MSQYQKTPFKALPTLLVSGTAEYVLGSWNIKTGPTLGYVISDSGNGTTSTVIFQITSGNVPIISGGSVPLVTIVGTANSSGGYNVTNVAVASVSVTDAGIATITFLGSGSSASAQDSGQVYIGQPEVGEVLAAVTSTPYSSVAVALPFNVSEMQEGKNVTASVSFPGSGVSAATVVLQGANIDLDGEYQTIGTLTAAGASAGGLAYYFASGQSTPAAPGNANLGGVNPINFKFLRIQVTASTGSGYVVGKILI